MGDKPTVCLFTAQGEKSFTENQRTRLAEVAWTRYVTAPDPLPASRLRELLREAQIAALTPRATPPLTPETIAALSHLKAIALPTTGTEWFPVADFEARGVVVKNLPGYSGQSTAEFTWALILSLTRKVLAAQRRVLTGEAVSLRGMELEGKTLGIIGGGDVGGRVARIAAGFGMRTLIHDALPERSHCALAELLAQSDLITLHLPLTSQTEGLLTEERLRQVKPGAFLINTARPALVDLQVAERLLDEGRLAGYAFDQGYFARERILPLARNPRVLAVPHVSWYTTEAIAREMEGWVEAILLLARSLRSA